MGGHIFFYGAIIDTPVLDLWWCLIWISNPAWQLVSVSEISVLVKVGCQIRTAVLSTCLCFTDAYQNGCKCIDTNNNTLKNCQLFNFGFNHRYYQNYRSCVWGEDVQHSS